MKHENSGFAALILSAGYSSRMKDFKPLMDVGGVTAVEGLIDSVRAAGIDDIAVVTGYGRERLQPVIAGAGVAEAYNPDFDRGMFTSIQTGIRRARELFHMAEGYFLMPVDCPLISPAVIGKLTDSIKGEFAEEVKAADAADFCPEYEGRAGACGRYGQGKCRVTECFYVPVFEGKKGHPLFIPAAYGKEICEYGGEGGLKAITDKYWNRMIRVPVEDEGCILDMDTPEGYREILSFLEKGRRREPLEGLAAGRRIFLIRHGQTRQHDEKMFIGQYDVELSDEGRLMMKETAGKLAGYGIAVDHIYCSDLIRASESADIIAAELNRCGFGKPEIVKKENFREIALGSWDGVPVREIKEKFPVEYQRRGQEIFTFKTGNRAENFYDMQYRAVRELRRILESDKSRDIILVTHSGVIRALENNLKGDRVNDPWDAVPKGGYVMVG